MSRKIELSGLEDTADLQNRNSLSAILFATALGLASLGMAEVIRVEYNETIEEFRKLGDTNLSEIFKQDSSADKQP